LARIKTQFRIHSLVISAQSPIRPDQRQRHPLPIPPGQQRHLQLKTIQLHLHSPPRAFVGSSPLRYFSILVYPSPFASLAASDASLGLSSCLISHSSGMPSPSVSL